MKRLGLLLLASCHATDLTSVHRLVATPDALTFPQTLSGEATFSLYNRGRDAEHVTLDVGAPFSVDPATADLAAGSALEVTVRFAPQQSGTFHQVVSIFSADASASVSLSG